ncbi:RagB/SusD family nutrient uptake outer membrane protein [Chryseobacterium sp. MEBOG07]|uniref:RagB/SusD family nutrient uptake outer membrane protein n=1 Tax=Chryseobacterium sp. MEBOG07 TaxID=2879939 RepID=UPI001F181EB7|nr:RagB/SusD family nutrient uptake outer membrane protein [Chryseobacterium sp. MEBOG07]UKB78583.1 RagB/SusD family nutrient uptake outer membrane protein [Chryseobacterium sp. MEBOG07]
MNTMKIVYAGCACLALLFTQSCELTEVTKLKPYYKLDEETVVTDIASAEKLLAGAYYSLKDEAMANQMGIYTSLMGLNVVSTAVSSFAFTNNTVQTSDINVNSYLYAGPYQLIQTANWVIDKTGALAVNDPRKVQIIAEARFLRALGHFYILRLFGEFWDLNSKFGVEIKDRPKLPVAARASVKTSYDFILSDLDEAILNGKDYVKGSKKGYATKLAAKAIKAKVLLYKKDYTGAAALAKEVMTGPAVLANNFVDLFQKEKHMSDEVILSALVFATGNSSATGKTYYWTSGGNFLSARYTALLAGDSRKAIIVKNFADPVDPSKWRGNGKFTVGVDGSGYDTEYYFRLAEAYLIYAEAEARRDGGVLTDALNVLNALRIKRGMNGVSAANKAELLALIRTEKELELGGESGEDWFDLVRYIKNGDVQASVVKPGLEDEGKLILPIPQLSIDASNKILAQNPGY